MNRMTIEQAVSLLDERPAKCRPTSPLHSEGYEVGGLDDVKVIVGWVAPRNSDLEKLLRDDRSAAALKGLLSRIDGIYVRDFASWRRRQLAASVDAVIREIHEEDEDEEDEDREVTEAAEEIGCCAEFVADGVIQKEDVHVMSATGSEVESPIRQIYIGRIIPTWRDASDLIERIRETAGALTRVGEKIGRKDPDVYVDGNYSSGICYDD